MQEAHLSVRKFTAGDEVAEGQAIDVSVIWHLSRASHCACQQIEYYI